MKFDFYTGGAVWRLLDAVCKEVAAPTWDADAFERVRDRLVRALRNVDRARADSHSSAGGGARTKAGAGGYASATPKSLLKTSGPRVASVEGCRALLHVHGAVDESMSRRPRLWGAACRR